MKKTMKKSDLIIVACLILVFTVIIFMNTSLINRTMMNQVEKSSLDRLKLIRYEYENVSADVEKLLTSIVYGADSVIAGGGTREDIEDFIQKQNISVAQRSNGIIFRLYIAGPDWEYIPGADVPKGYRASDQEWFKEAKENRGKMIVTDPYHDRLSGTLCSTLSMSLHDKDMVVGMDMTLDGIQDYITRMSGENHSKAMIVTDNGMIVGYSDMNYVGTKLSASLPEYDSVLSKIIQSSEDDNYFKVNLSEGEVTAVYSKMANGWYMAVFLTDKDMYGDAIAYRWANIIVNVLLLLFIVISFIMGSRNRIRAQEALRSREAFIGGILNKLHDPLGNILRLSDMERFNNSNDIKADMADIKASSLQLKEMMDNLRSYSTIVSESGVNLSVKKKERRELAQTIRRFRNVIIVILILVSGLSMYFYVRNRGSVVRETVLGELDDYMMELNVWEVGQTTALQMFTENISSQPDMLKDYESTKAWLSKMALKDSSCSMCYIANPYAEHTLISNTGWVPDEDFDFTQRDWYQEAYRHYPDQYISKPYFEESEGKYCITFSQAVFDENMNFLGVFGIDIHLEKLVQIFDGVTSENKYAFLVDCNGNIMNHPNPDYKMTTEHQMNIADTPYSGAYLGAGNESVRYIRDYDGTYSICVCKTDKSGFTVVMVGNFWVWYKEIILYCGVYLFFIVSSIITVILLLNRVIRSQAEMNHELSVTADRAMVAGRAKSDFLAQMSHEIRTPINAVIGMDEMILRENNDPEIRDYAENIKSASQTLLTLINGILDFSKIESGKMEILCVRYETLDMIDNLVNVVADRAEKKGLNLILDIDPKLPSSLLGDDLRIRQVITNLLTNAVKYTQEGDVTLSIKYVPGEEDACFLDVAVADTGIGIKKEDMEALFQSFQRLDEVKNRHIEGTGLGMSIVQGLLGMMNSKLDVESTYGKGSTFSFRLEQKVIDSTEIGEYQRLRNKDEEKKVVKKSFILKDTKILVVDDNEMNLKVAKGLLKRYLVVPDLCASGRKSLTMVQEKAYDLVLMDHMMPGLDGVEALKEIREKKLMSEKIPVIALTANAILGAREEYLGYGFSDYLSKPIDIQQLEEMLIKYLPEEKVIYVENSDSAANGSDSNTAVSDSDGAVEGSDGSADGSDGSADGSDGSTDGSDGTATMNDSDSTEGGSDGAGGSADTALGSFTDKLAAAGFNIEEAHSYTMDDDEFYLELLQTFAGTAGEKEETVRKLYEEENWKDYQIAVHGLKSSARTIGADTLADLALAQEMAAKGNDISTIRAGVDELLKVLHETTKTIEDAI
ncbi:MAG: response regulator [Eubacterium sp.]|nr:response regulator [Eubacterium sp.]